VSVKGFKSEANRVGGGRGSITCNST